MSLMTKIVTSTFRRTRTVVGNRSPFSGKAQMVGFQDWQWVASFQYRTMKKAEGAALLAIIAGLGEGTGTVNLGDPDFRAPMSGYGGSLTVSGAGQTGMSLTVSGTASTTVLKAGDFVQVPFAGAAAQLFRLTADAVTNGSGIATLALDAPMRGSPANGATLTLTNTAIPFRVRNYSHSFDVSGFMSLSIEAEEAL